MGDGLLEEMRRLKGKIWKMLEVAEEAGDRIAFTASVRELRQTIGGYFELAERAAPEQVLAGKVTLEQVLEARNRAERVLRLAKPNAEALERNDTERAEYVQTIGVPAVPLQLSAQRFAVHT